MLTKVQRWGNSQGLRFTKAILEEARLDHPHAEPACLLRRLTSRIHLSTPMTARIDMA